MVNTLKNLLIIVLIARFLGLGIPGYASNETILENNTTPNKKNQKEITLEYAGQTFEYNKENGPGGVPQPGDIAYLLKPIDKANF